MDLSVSEMMELQRALFLRHKGDWSPMEPEYGKDFNDVLLRYHVTPEEISEAYRKKHNLNMARDYEQEYKELYNG